MINQVWSSLTISINECRALVEKAKPKGSGSLPAPWYYQNLISSSYYHPGPLHQISWQSVHNFFSNCIYKQTDKQTNTTESITSLAKVWTSTFSASCMLAKLLIPYCPCPPSSDGYLADWQSTACFLEHTVWHSISPLLSLFARLFCWNGTLYLGILVRFWALMPWGWMILFMTLNILVHTWFCWDNIGLNSKLFPQITPISPFSLMLGEVSLKNKASWHSDR